MDKERLWNCLCIMAINLLVIFLYFALCQKEAVESVPNLNSDISHLYQMEEEGEVYEFTVKNRSGNIIFNEQYQVEPVIISVNDNTLLTVRGKGDFHICTFINVDTGLVSEEFEDISAWNSGMVAYAVWQDGAYKIVVQDIYNKNDYYMEIERDFSPMAVPHFIIKEAVFLDDSTLKVKYRCGENFDTKEEIIDLKSNDGSSFGRFHMDKLSPASFIWMRIPA